MQLEMLYNKYGYFGMEASYFMCDDPAKMGTIFDRLRPQQASDTYDTSCGGYAISAVRDLTTGFDSSQPGDQAILPVDPSSQVINDCAAIAYCAAAIDCCAAVNVFVLKQFDYCALAIAYCAALLSCCAAVAGCYLGVIDCCASMAGVHL